KVYIGDSFYHAEDGIRVFHVTGVQTCALPILQNSAPSGSSTSITPIEVAMPLPPRKPSSTLKLLPSTTASPASAAPHGPTPRSSGRAVATEPLSGSGTTSTTAGTRAVIPRTLASPASP